MAVTGSRPVAGRPRRFFGTTVFDFFIKCSTVKASRGEVGRFRPGSNPDHGRLKTMTQADTVNITPPLTVCLICSPDGGRADPTGKLFPQTTLPASGSPPPHPAPAPARGRALEPPSLPRLSRRSVIATMLAAAAPVAGTVVALPAAAVAPAVPVVSAALEPAVAESAELLAIGAEVDAMLEDYRAAAAHLAEARAIATELWPAAPAGLVVIGDVRRGRYVDCYEDEVDFEGNRWPTLLAGAGCGAPLHRYIATVGGLTCLLEDVRTDAGDLWETGFDRELLGRIGEAERYEAACAHAIEVSGIAEAKEGARRRAQDLHSLLFEVRKHRPRSVTGILIMARAVMAFEEAQKDSVSAGERTGGLVLGRELADAVLSFASPLAQASGSLTHA